MKYEIWKGFIYYVSNIKINSKSARPCGISALPRCSQEAVRTAREKEKQKQIAHLAPWGPPFFAFESAVISHSLQRDSRASRQPLMLMRKSEKWDLISSSGTFYSCQCDDASLRPHWWVGLVISCSSTRSAGPVLLAGASSRQEWLWQWLITPSVIFCVRRFVFEQQHDILGKFSRWLKIWREYCWIWRRKFLCMASSQIDWHSSCCEWLVNLFGNPGLFQNIFKRKIKLVHS